MRKVIRPYDELAERHSTVFGFTHHITKNSINNNNAGVTSIMGAGSIVNKSRCSFLFKKDKETKLHYLTQVKTNSSDEFLDKEIELKLDSEFFTFEITVNEQKKETDKGGLAQLCQAVFKGKLLSYPEYVIAYKQETKKGSSCAYKDLLSLKKAGLVIKNEDTKKWESLLSSPTPV